jgi:penicillin-binding protein 2
MLTEKTSSEKIVLISYLIIIGFIIILLRLWQLQILQGNKFRQISESNRMRIIGVPAPRGIIFDRNGIPLVKDTPYFSASIISEEFNQNDINALSKILNIPVDEATEKLTEKPESPFKPIRLKERLSFKEVSFIEARRSDFPGLIIEISDRREYIYGKTGAHVIGYLGKLTPSQSKNPEFKDVPPHAFIGQWGIEKLFDKSLRGIAGQRVIEVDALGREIRLFQEKNPVKGEDITLSIDIALQKEAEKAFMGKAGALVALKPETGEILGLVSAPSFDPNKFTKGISYDEWMDITQDKKFPMLNRAIQSQYPPGSIFKIITAIAALEEGVIDDATKVECKGSINYGKRRFGCWKKSGHGVISIHRALVESCDIFFYEAGKRLGIDKMAEYAFKFGFGKETGIPIANEEKGLVPDTKWKMETKKTKWFLGETVINAIGQGYLAVTPVQAAVMMSTVSNGGIRYRPVILRNSDPIPVSTVDVKPETLEIIRDSLKGVVHEQHGTGRAALSNMTTIGGKTGTAQVVGIRKDAKKLPEKFRDHAWFVAFAPVEDPEIALAVFVEHGGHGGSTAAPIAKKTIEAYLLSEDAKKELLNVQN